MFNIGEDDSSAYATLEKMISKMDMDITGRNKKCYLLLKAMMLMDLCLPISQDNCKFEFNVSAWHTRFRYEKINALLDYIDVLMMRSGMNVAKKLWFRLNLLMTHCIQFVMIQFRGGILSFRKNDIFKRHGHLLKKL